jgi:hypothetical protein
LVKTFVELFSTLLKMIFGGVVSLGPPSGAAGSAHETIKDINAQNPQIID